MRLSAQQKTFKFLVLLILADVAFLVLNILHTYSGWGGILSSPLFSLDMDRGHAEFYQYLKMFWVILLLIFMAFRSAPFLHLSWSALFLYLLLDDLLELHETLGAQVADMLVLQPVFGLRPIDIGELAVSLFFGGLLFGLILLAWLLSDKTSRKFSNKILILVAILAFFGVFLDMLDIVIFGAGNSILNLLENWGEMLVTSVIVWFVFINSDSHSKTSSPQPTTA
jgi:hypothetical protein